MFKGLKYKQWNCDVNFRKYAEGRIAITLDSPTDGPIATASVNMPDHPCKKGEVYVKDYSENAGMAQWLIDNGVIHDGIISTVPSGYVEISRYKLTAYAQRQTA